MQNLKYREKSLRWHLVLVVIGIIFFFALESHAFAQCPRGDMLRTDCPYIHKHARLVMPIFWENPAMVKYLQLNPEQVAALQKAGDANKRQTSALYDGIRKSRSELEQAFRQTPIDESKVRNLGAAIAADESRLSSLAIDLRLQAAKILTPQQLKTITDLRHPRMSLD